MTAEQSLPVFQGHDILKATGGTLIQGNPAGFLSGISTDSRRITKGNLFIP